MPDRKTPDSPSEFLDRVERFLDTTDGLGTAEIAAELRSDGVDPEALLSRVRGFLESTRESVRLQWLPRAQEERARALVEFGAVTVSSPKTRSDILAKIEAFMVQLPPEQASGFRANFRNFQAASDDDLRGLLADLERLLGLGPYKPD